MLGSIHSLLATSCEVVDGSSRGTRHHAPDRDDSERPQEGAPGLVPREREGVGAGDRVRFRTKGVAQAATHRSPQASTSDSSCGVQEGLSTLLAPPALLRVEGAASVPEASGAMKRPVSSASRSRCGVFAGLSGPSSW